MKNNKVLMLRTFHNTEDYEKYEQIIKPIVKDEREKLKRELFG